MIELISLWYRFNSRLKAVANIAVAKKSGLKIGKNTILVGLQSFGSEPFLIEIGGSCLITDGVRFVTHDGAIQVPLIAAGERIDDIYSKKSTFDKIKVGDNVFVGVSSILLAGTIIGDNSIVAAGSVVKGRFPPGVVLAGQPARIIGTIDDYMKKNVENILLFNDREHRVEQIMSHLKKIGK